MTINGITLPATLGDSFHNQFRRLCHLEATGFNPQSILDIGAYHGGWSVMVKAIWSRAKVKTVEANEECRAPLTRDGHDFEITVMAETDGEADFHKCDNGCGEGNSLFRENSIHSFTTHRLPTKSLATLAGDQTFDLIKMDCQGAELSIIRGGPQVIQRAAVVLLECQIQSYNEGAPVAAEVIAEMGRLGFRLYDIVDFHHNSRGLLIQVDLLFARSDSPLFTIRPLS